MKKFFFISIAIFLFGYSSMGQKIGSYFNLEKNSAVDGTGNSFVDLVDGTRVNGSKVDIGGNFRTVVIIDKEKYPLSKVKGLQMGNKYFTNLNGEFYQAIIIGKKVSVYRKGFQTYTNGVSETLTSYYYIKNGSKLISIRNIDDIINAIGDCKATKSFNNLDKDDLKDKIKNNKSFLNEYFEKYNKECK